VKKHFLYLVPVALLVLVAVPQIHAQIDGCTDSPENPTAVLAVIGAASMGISHMWRRFRARNK
jgi:XrtJ-associated TM-motif-TM protein